MDRGLPPLDERRKVAMGRQPIEIDRAKLRAAVRKLGHEYVFYMLDDAIDLLPPAKLYKMVKKYLKIESLRPDVDKSTQGSLLADVKDFEKRSLAGEYYESFRVNSQNYMEQSRGTTAWIAECCRLLDRCVSDKKKSSPAEVRGAFDTIFSLLDRVDECRDDVIFFADEGGSWQVGVKWERVLPAWFEVLSATAEPEEYAERITSLIERHYHYRRGEMLTIARKTATPDQRKALADVTRRQARLRRRGDKP